MFKYPAKTKVFTPLNLKEKLTSTYLIEAFLHYGFAILLTVIVIVLKNYFPEELGAQSPYLMAIFAVFMSAYYGGLWPGLFATLLTALAVDYFITPPLHHISLDLISLERSFIYMGQGAMVSWLLERVAKGRINEYRQRRWFETTLASIGDAVIATDSFGEIVFMNKVAEDLTGWKFKNVYTKPLSCVFNIVNEETRKKVDNPVMRVLKENKVVGLANHTVLINKNGKKIPIDDSAAPIKDKYNRLVGVVLVFRDITDRRAFEQRKDEFMSIASHELKTPLTTVKAYAQMLEKIITGCKNDRALLYINRTNNYIDRLNDLIADLLNVSKIQAGKLNLYMEEFDVDEMLDQGIESAQLVTDTHKIIKEGMLKCRLTGDRNRLEQVLNNLLSNAIKYSPKANKIIVQGKRTNGKLTVSVKDYGIGIPKNHQDRLFERFYRVEGVAHKFSGLGIGLYIAHEIVKRHGGRMWVKSQEGKGSTFYLSLPMK